MYREPGDTAARIKASHIHRLLDSTEAGQDFISQGQLESFYKRPDGPRVPAECLEVRLLLSRNTLPRQELSMLTILKVLVGKNGELYCLFQQGDTYKVCCHGRQIVRVIEVAKSMALGSDFTVVPSLQGIHDGQPVTRVSCITLDMVHHAPPEWVSFMRGAEEYYSAKDGEESHLLLAHGEMLCANRLITDGYDILLGGKAVDSCPFTPRFFQDSTDEVHVFAYDASRSVSVWWTLGKQDKVEYKGIQIEGLVETPDGVMAVTYLREGIRRIMRRDGEQVAYLHGYSGNFQILGRRFVYKAARKNGGESLVVNTRCQPCFDAVSPAFKRDDQWLYYGVTGGHIYTMEVPEAI